MDYEAWKPALIAFYRADGWFQSAENLEKFGYPLSIQDKRLIEALEKAFAQAPETDAAWERWMLEQEALSLVERRRA